MSEGAREREQKNEGPRLSSPQREKENRDRKRRTKGLLKEEITDVRIGGHRYRCAHLPFFFRMRRRNENEGMKEWRNGGIKE